jgi:NAD(P) transhydrogenase
MSRPRQFDLCVIGAGPAGQKAAIQAAKAGRSVAIIEQDRRVGGACVHTGTIPSKALREQALRSRGRFDATRPAALYELLTGVDAIVASHDRYMGQQLARNGVRCLRGRARFKNDTMLQVQRIDGSRYELMADVYIIATGSRPRAPDGIDIDHEHVLDSDSILGLAWLPRSLIVLGGGVIASEYACTFSALGCKVTQVDRAARPLAFLDGEILDVYLEDFARGGAEWLGGHGARGIRWDGVSSVCVELDDGTQHHAEKVLVALGRVANVESLGLDAAGVELTARGHVAVDAEFRTTASRIFAAGDVIGPPSLASAAMEQGRLAACHALGLLAGERDPAIPSGVYTLPEIATVGLSEREALAQHGQVIVGRARFKEIARGQIAGAADGLARIVSDCTGRRLLGAQVIGEQAAELVHVVQMAIAHDAPVDILVDQVFNFPTLAEAWRVAALDVIRQRPAALRPGAPAGAPPEDDAWSDAVAAI